MALMSLNVNRLHNLTQLEWPSPGKAIKQKGFVEMYNNKSDAFHKHTVYFQIFLIGTQLRG
jgi:hypothetical protein